MKIFKTGLAIFAFSALMLVNSAFTFPWNETTLTISDERVFLRIARHTEKEEIKELQARLLEKGIELTIENLEYKCPGTIKGIEGAIKFKDGSSASFQSGLFFRKVVMVRNYDPAKGEPSFIIR